MKIKDKHGRNWQLVPVEPSVDMWIPSYHADINWPMRQKIYKDMISAAPAPELPEGLEPVAWMWSFEDGNGAAFCSTKPHASINDGVNYVPLILQSSALALLEKRDAEIAILKRDFEAQHGDPVRCFSELQERITKLTAALEAAENALENCGQGYPADDMDDGTFCDPALVTEALAAIKEALK